MTQAFKPNDALEAKVTLALSSGFDVVGSELTEFYDNAYSCQQLGATLWDADADPMAGPVSRESFLLCFQAIHLLFTRPGTFEFYLGVFRAIWGEDVDVEFVVPAPGKLEIDIEALAVSEDLFMARSIVDNAYVYDEVVDDNGDNIVFQVPTGIQTQQEVDALMKELYPAGLWVETTLTIS